MRRASRATRRPRRSTCTPGRSSRARRPGTSAARAARSDPRRVDAERTGEALAQPLERELAVLELRAPLGHHDTHARTEPFEQADALPGAERLGRLDVEAELDPGVGRVGVLATGP